MKGPEFSLDTPKSKETQHTVILKKYFKRHLALAVFSALLAVASQEEVKAQQEVTQVTSTADTVGTSANLDLIKINKQEAYANLRLIIEKGDILNKVAKLEEELGPLANTFLSIHQIKQDLELLEKIENKKGNSVDLVSLVDAYKKRWAQPDIKNREPVYVSNIDGKIKGFLSEDLDDFLTDTYPANYTSNNVGRIEFTNEINAKGGDEILGQATVFGVDKPVVVGEKRGSVKINLPKEGIDKNLFEEVLRHEIGHNADQNNSPVLTSAERVSMLYEVFLRSKSPDRYRSEYLDQITMQKLGLYIDESKITDEKLRKQYLSYILSTEYWAEAQKAYFKDKEKFKKKYPVDYALVDKWVKILSK